MKLEKICHISSGGTPSRGKSHFYGGDIPWAKISDIENSKNGILTETEEKITEEGLKSIGNRIFPKGTLLFAMYGSIGKVAITGREIATNQAILGIRPRGINEIYLPYLKVWFESNKQKLINQGRGVALQNLSATIIRNLDVPIPAYTEQLHIADLLSKAENLISLRKQSIDLLDDFLKSKFLQMFGDPVRRDIKWEIVPLSKLGTLDRGVSKNRPRNLPELLGGKYPLIQTGEVSNAGLYITKYTHTYSELGLKQSKLWGKGTLLITIAANIAQTSILTFDACFPDSVVGFVVDEKQANTIYVHYLFGFFQKILEKNAPQAAQKNINLALLRVLEVPKPPIELQSRFTQIVEKTEALKSQHKSSLQELENLYGSLSQRAFRGELTLLMPESLESMAAEANTKYEVGKGAGIQPRICNSPEKAILAGHIIYQTNNEHFGRVKFQKLLHLTSYFCKVDVDSNFTKKAAGPHDRHLIADIESTLSRFHFYNIKQSNLGNHRVNYTPLSALSNLEDIYKSKFVAEKERIDSFLEKFKKSSWEQCEIVSTLYAVWNNRIIRKEDVSDDALKQDFLNWDAQKVKYKNRLDKALQWMRDEGVIPDGWGKLIE